MTLQVRIVFCLGTLLLAALAGCTGTPSDLAGQSIDLSGSLLGTNGASDEDVLGYTPDAPPSGSAPVAEAGGDQTVSSGQLVQLDASASTDPDGDVLSFNWEQVGGPPVTLNDPTLAGIEFVTPEVAADAVLEFLLTVSDGQYESTDIVTVYVVADTASESANRQFGIVFTPLAYTGYLAVKFQAATLDGQPLPAGTYAWDFGDGQMRYGKAATHRYAQAGTYLATLCVTLAEITTPICVTATVLAGQPPAAQPPTTAPTTTPTTWEITGHINTASGPLSGATLWDEGAGSAVDTDNVGAYAIAVGANWSGVIVPEHPDYQFEPPYRLFMDLTANQTLDFTATRIIPQTTGGLPPPGFLVCTPDGKRRIYFGAVAYNDDLLSAHIRLAGTNEWQLAVTSRKAISEVWFPWDANQVTMGGDITDDIIYYPYLAGTAVQASSLKEFGWGGNPYPGVSFAPLVIQADNTRARLVAAANWPPRQVTPMYSRGRLTLVYKGLLPAGTSRSFRAIIAEATGDAAAGEIPWCRAADVYKNWLAASMARENMSPVPYSPAVQNVHGWLNVGLQNMRAFDEAHVRSLWQEYKTVFPWMQFWGQMSNYAGKPSLSVPTLDPGEAAGCCLGLSVVHRRYKPGLPELAANMTGEGLVGFYCRPRDPYAALDNLAVVSGKTNIEFLTDWANANIAQLHANAVYIDVLGGLYFGHPLVVSKFIQTRFPQNTVIEHAVDVYPTSYLVSGALTGGAINGGPNKTPDKFAGTFTVTTFPNLGRYLLSDRIMFLGGSNGDHAYWGAAHGYWTERQAFLLGCKLDVTCVGESSDRITPMNAGLQMIVREWERTNWWQRSPLYMDRLGVTQVPAGIDVRHYVDNSGVNLFVIDNWQQQSGTQFLFNGSPMAVPAEKLSIVSAP